ncbi:MAG: hypothetical protein ACXVH3_25790 [Solirubrobacteraceae bacterium]
MDTGDSGHSPDLDAVRQMLFPTLSAEEGWARIERAIRSAADGERWAAIEERAKRRRLTDLEWAAIEEAATHQDLPADLLERLRVARARDRE